jgi:UDP-glucose 4-epimerase
MERLLIIGASGSLGKGVIRQLKKQYEITGTYLNTLIDVDGIKKERVDICNKDTLYDLKDDYDCVLLIAGAMPAEMKGYVPQKYIDVNITGVHNVLEFCRVRGIKKIIYIMTFSDVSGKFYTGEPILESDHRSITYTGDHAIYAISKVTACELLEHYHQEYGLQTIIFRIPTVYCNDENINYYVDGEQRVKAYIQMIRSIVNDHRIEIWGNPEHAKDMPYIEDFARLIGKAVVHPSAQGLYNAGTGSPISLKVFVDTLIEVFSDGEKVEKIYRPEKPSQPNFTFDMSRTFETFDYQVQYTLKDMFNEIKTALIDTEKLYSK